VREQPLAWQQQLAARLPAARERQLVARRLVAQQLVAQQRLVAQWPLASPASTLSWTRSGRH
jgi:hypothetical protein